MYSIPFITESAVAPEAMKSRSQRPLSPSVPTNKRVYVLPTADDVLRGRGGKTNNHPGNRRLLKLVRPLETVYTALKRGQKAGMSQQMVDEVHAWGGRFLGKETNGQGENLFYIMDSKSAIKLVEQKFRDKPSKRKSRHNKQPIADTDDDDDEMIFVNDLERLAFDESGSWSTFVESLGSAPTTNPAPSDPDSEAVSSFIHCVSPAPSMEDVDIQMPSDDELDDISLTEEEINELTLDPPQYSWGNFTSIAVEDPSLYFSDNYLIDLCMDGGDFYDLTT